MRNPVYSTCTVLKDRLHFIKDIQDAVSEATGERLPQYEVVAYALEMLWKLRDELILRVVKAVAQRRKDAAREAAAEAQARYLKRRQENGLTA